MESLCAHLPPGSASRGDIAANVRSPQFQQALASFTAALQTGQLADVVRAFGLPADPGATGLVTAVIAESGAAGAAGAAAGQGQGGAGGAAGGAAAKDDGEAKPMDESNA